MNPAPVPPTARRGFTLVELLMVIVIIAILIGLLVVTVVPAITKGKVATVRAEIDQLHNAVERYKMEFGAYPPSPGVFPDAGGENNRRQRMERHFRKAFPRFNGTYADARTFILQATNSPGATPPQADLDDLDSAEALVFFLGGLPVRRPNPSGGFSFELTRFSANPENPFEHVDSQSQRTQILFDFDPRRLVDYDGDGWAEYIPPGTTTVADMPPYVYFDLSTYALFPHYPHNPQGFPANFFPRSPNLAAADWGYCFPYVSDWNQDLRISNPGDPRQWGSRAVNDRTFQIISAGADGRYSGEVNLNWAFPLGQDMLEVMLRRFPEGTHYTDADNDNVTNFTDTTLEAAKP